LHGLILVIANLAAILIGFLVYKAVRPVDQVVVQLLAGLALSVLLYSVWTVLAYKLPFRRLRLSSVAEFMWAYVVSLAWGPAIFVPLHYSTQGYLTSGGNLLALVSFQLPVNALAVLVASRLIKTAAVRRVD
jgi:hypothetical protein